MNTGKTIFSQVMEFLPMYEFHKCVERYHGERKMLKFSCLDQYFEHELRAVNVSRESSRYRILSALDVRTPVSHGFPGKNFSEHIGRYERKPRLAHLRRFCDDL